MLKFVIEVMIQISVGCLSCEHDNKILISVAGCLCNRFSPSEASYFVILALLTQYAFQI